MTWKYVVAGVGAVAAVYGLSCAGLYAAMLQPPERFGAFMAKVPRPLMPLLPFRPLWMEARAGNLRPGDIAPDFTLPSLDGRAVRLSDEYRARPVVLAFGSYT